MPKYEVGSLQIAFEAIDKTASNFETLKKSLQSIRNLISNIANADVNKFSTNIKKITRDLSPFLTEVKGASAELSELGIAFKQLSIYRVSKVATEFSSIQNAIEETNNATRELTQGIETYERQTEEVIENVKQSFQAFSLVTNQDIAQGIGGQILALGETLKKQESELAEFRKAWEQAVQDQDLAKINSMTLAIDIVTRSINGTKNAIAELRGETETIEKPVKKATSGWKKFIKSIGRIALYRAIRRALQLLTQSITETIQEFAKVDDSINDTVSKATSSLKVIQLSFGATFLPLLQAVTPILQQIAVGFANVANVISAAMADGDTYWAINAQAIQDYREQLEKTSGSLASFDKIQSLSGQSSFSFLEQENVADLNDELGGTRINLKGIYFLISGIGDLLASALNIINKITGSTVFQTVIGAISWIIGGLAKVVSWITDVLVNSGLIEPILGGILGYLIAIGATKIITLFTSGAVKTFFVNLITHLKNTKNGLLGVLTRTQALAISVGALAGSILYFISSLDDMGSTAKWLVPLIAGVTAVIVGLTTALVAMYSAHLGIGAAIKAGLTAAALSGAIALAVGTTIAKAQPMAAGGAVPSGTLFYAGEAGAETVTVGSSGRTEVTNVSQMETALYNALVRYGRENRGSDSAIQINIDGQKVFEATRREANRKGLDFKRV